MLASCSSVKVLNSGTFLSAISSFIRSSSPLETAAAACLTHLSPWFARATISP